MYIYYLVSENHRYVRLNGNEPVDTGEFEVNTICYDSIRDVMMMGRRIRDYDMENYLFDTEKEAYKCAIEMTVKKLSQLLAIFKERTS